MSAIKESEFQQIPKETIKTFLEDIATVTKQFEQPTLESLAAEVQELRQEIAALKQGTIVSDQNFENAVAEAIIKLKRKGGN